MNTTKAIAIFFSCITIIATTHSCTIKSNELIQEDFEYVQMDVSQFKKGNASLQLSEEESKQIIQSEEVKNLIQLQNKFLKKIKAAQKAGISLERIKSAAATGLNENDDTEFLTLVFGNVQDGRAFINEMTQARVLFFAKNEVLRNNTAAFGCLDCEMAGKVDLNDFFNKFEGYYQRSLQWDTNNSNTNVTTQDIDIEYGEDEPVCGSYWQQTKLIACMALCSGSTGGLGTPLCGWACWCMLCPENSAVAEAIC